ELCDDVIGEGALPPAVGAGPPTTVATALTATPRRAAAGAFGLIALAEWGDLTQLATAGLAARSDNPAFTGLGAFVALASVAAIAATVGRQLVARVALHRINYLSAAVFAALAVWSTAEVLL